MEALEYSSEGIVNGDGRSYVTLFAGDDAQMRAEEYFIWKTKDQ